MDLHDGLGDGAEQGLREPPGSESEPAAAVPGEGTGDAGGYDGSGRYDAHGDTGTDSGGDTGTDSGGDTGTDSGGDTGTDPGDSAAGGTMIVEVDGATRELPAERDYTGDGRPDAVAETSDGRVIVFADTEDNETGAAGPDGRADEAYVVDKATGRVVATAHIDPASGKWVEGVDSEGPIAAGSGGSGGSGGEPEPAGGPGSGRAPDDGSGGPGVVTVEVGGQEIGVAATVAGPGDPSGTPGDTGDPGGSGGAGAGGAGGGGGSGGSGGTGTMTVDLGGESRELPAERDYTGDGRPDAAAETSDGRVIVFADTEDNETGAAGPDGRADEAYVVDKRTGRVVGTAHVDPRTGEWVEGADADGSPAVPSSTGGEVDS